MLDQFKAVHQSISGIPDKPRSYSHGDPVNRGGGKWWCLCCKFLNQTKEFLIHFKSYKNFCFPLTLLHHPTPNTVFYKSLHTERLVSQTIAQLFKQKTSQQVPPFQHEDNLNLSWNSSMCLKSGGKRKWNKQKKLSSYLSEKQLKLR